MNPRDIPWQPFSEALRLPVEPSKLCLWWVPIRGSVEVFTGRVVYWPAADCAMVGRKSGSLVRVTDGAFYAIITEPPKPPTLDDAIDVCAAHVTGSTATASPAPAPSLPPPAASQLSASPAPRPLAPA